MVPALLLAAAVSASCAWKNPRISGSMSVIVRYPFKIPFKFDFSAVSPQEELCAESANTI